ncbi:MAG: LytR C-terminal domain-containing protein [Acidimicrobiales bacterium]
MTQPGSTQPSIAGAAGRGLALVAFAVILGLVLLQSTVDGPDAATSGTSASAPDTTQPTDGETTTTTEGEGSVTTTTLEGETTTTTEPNGEMKPRNELRLIVVNVNGITGSAGKLTDQLNAFGYITEDGANGTGEDLENSVIYYEPGFAAEANRLAGDDLQWSLEQVQQKPADIPADLPEDVELHFVIMLGKTEAGG